LVDQLIRIQTDLMDDSGSFRLDAITIRQVSDAGLLDYKALLANRRMITDGELIGALSRSDLVNEDDVSAHFSQTFPGEELTSRVRWIIRTTLAPRTQFG
jgi:hypothetical protein